MRCAELGRSPVQLLADWLAGGGTPLLRQADSRFVIFTQSGRSAILLAARLWQISGDDEVLVPAYNCGSEISPLIATGAHVAMYRVDDSAQIDLADLRRRITDRTRLIHVIHYFGRPTDLTELAAHCRERNIKLLEDCALSLFSGTTGRTGDGAIFSFYKTLPACSGGALMLRHPPSHSEQLVPNHFRPTAHEMLALLKKWTRGWLGALPQPAWRPPSQNEALDRPAASWPDIPSDYYCDPNAIVHAGSRLTNGAIRRANVERIVRSRRQNYALLQRLLLNAGGPSLLWEEPLDEQTCPLGLPILVGNKSLWRERLNAAGIPVSSWWTGCHRGLDWSEYPEALALKAHLVLLPVHQDLDARHIEYIARAVLSLASTE